MANAKTFVLVHGGWCGGWAWDDIRPMLEAEGHQVITPTLSGLAERSDELDAETNLSNHIAQIEKLILDEDLNDAVLVGSSYGGLVISGAADRLGPDRIGSLVYVDALYLGDGETMEVPQGQGPKVELVDGVPCFLPPPASAFDLVGETKERWDANFTPFPIACLTEVPRITGLRDQVSRKTFVVSKRNPMPHFRNIAAGLRGSNDWQVIEIETHHVPYAESPGYTAELLLKIAA